MPAARLSPNPTTATSRRKLLLSYAPDWIITLVLAAVFFSLDPVHGFRRQFSLEDTSIRHTFAVHERIPDFALYLIAIVAPVVLQAVINLLTIRSWWDLHNSLLGLILGLSITGSITQFTKLTVGRPRPDLIDRCQPIPGSVDPVTRRSPLLVSASLAFYLAGKLHLFDHRGYAFKAWVSLVPFAGAALVAISRTMDNRHHWQVSRAFIQSAFALISFEDVLVGSVLGTVVSYFTYRQYYPSLTSEVSHRPYSPRIARADEHLVHHRRSGPRAAYRDENPTAEDIIGSGPLEGTVLRDGPGPLHEVWRDNEETTALQPHNNIPLESVV
ncbi:putative diacylglycerol pyrophosphate phosphatase 1 [Mycena venus]|uniref:Putative diacylglycerol pyrophosphate phosphatase 1 n=1 Tax=Mycena venus TaxID=2733690 RepID=A0A8H7CJD6_9AGAR|nr:putative diacylglycerol pyrophosphate phosphatase 1 [Mycena venus]